MMAWTPLIQICEIFMEPTNPMDRGPMELQTTKTQETLILKGSSTVSAKASLVGKKQANMYLCRDGKQTITQIISLIFSMFFFN